jgi:hypothetical protein
MKIFISWSSDRSLLVAEKLKEWLPLVLPYAEPWLSSEDIRKGSRWQAEMSEALQNPAAGILVLTQDNLHSTWLHFEAGAISKAISGGTSSVCTYLIDLDTATVGPPLGMFQGTRADREDTLRLIKTLNEVAAGEAIPNDRLEKLFSSFWPELDAIVAQAKMAAAQPKAKRAEYEVLEEILEVVRGLARRADGETPETFAEVVRKLSNTPGTSTYDLVERMEAAAKQHIPPTSLRRFTVRAAPSRSNGVPSRPNKNSKVPKRPQTKTMLCHFCRTRFDAVHSGQPCPSCGKSRI